MIGIVTRPTINPKGYNCSICGETTRTTTLSTSTVMMTTSTMKMTTTTTVMMTTTTMRMTTTTTTTTTTMSNKVEGKLRGFYQIAVFLCFPSQTCKFCQGSHGGESVTQTSVHAWDGSQKVLKDGTATTAKTSDRKKFVHSPQEILLVEDNRK